MAGDDLGSASLHLDVTGFAEFEGKITDAHTVADRLEDKLRGVAAVADVTGHMLGQVEISTGQAARTAGSVASILEGVHGISDEARDAARGLDDVHLGQAQAGESVAAGDEISDNLDKIDRKANAARHSLDRVRLAGGRTGVGVGPFGSGFGRVGLLGTAIGLGAVTAPAAAPALAGLFAGIPTLGAGALGVIGTLVLALHGMGKAISGDAKAYKELEPEQQKFVMSIRSLIPWIDRLKETAAQGLVPGLTTGLTEALSPGTVAVIQQSIGLISSTLGQAAATWGRYLGSPEFQSIFGPLMVSGARNLGVMAVAALNLFDALGLLGRAGIPFVNWITDALAIGAKLADQWLHAKDASGELAHGMDEAQTSLRLVGGLLLAVIRAVGALGVALYPVAKVAVKDLTDGLNALAGWITRNQGVIRDLVGTALTGLVTAVELAARGISLLVSGLEHIGVPADAAKEAIFGVGIALTIALGPQGAAITAAILGAVFVVGEITKHWDQLRTFFSNWRLFLVGTFHAAWTAVKGEFYLGVYAVLLSIEALSRGLAKAVGWVPGIGPKIRHALAQVDGFIESFRTRGLGLMAQAGSQWGEAFGRAFTSTASAQVNEFFKKADALKQPGAEVLGPPAPAAKASVTKKANEPAPGTRAWYLKYLGYDPTDNPPSSVFGKPPPFSKNVPKAPTEKQLEIPLSLQLRQAAADASGIEARQKAAARAIKAWAERMIASGKLTTRQHIDALQLIAQENSVLDTKQQATQLEVPLRLQVQEAKANASGVESKQRAAARAIRNWAERMIRSGKLTTQQLIDAYNLIAQENSALANKVNTVARGANEKQFLDSFQALVGSFDSNAEQQPPQTGGRSETHLYELVHETRQQNTHLKDIKTRGSFPGSAYQGASAEAAIG